LRNSWTGRISVSQPASQPQKQRSSQIFEILLFPPNQQPNLNAKSFRSAAVPSLTQKWYPARTNFARFSKTKARKIQFAQAVVSANPFFSKPVETKRTLEPAECATGAEGRWQRATHHRDA
jgi:hypothetical protein